MEVETGILFVNACLIIQTNVLDSLEIQDLSMMGYGFSNMDKDLYSNCEVSGVCDVAQGPLFID